MQGHGAPQTVHARQRLIVTKTMLPASVASMSETDSIMLADKPAVPSRSPARSPRGGTDMIHVIGGILPENWSAQTGSSQGHQPPPKSSQTAAGREVKQQQSSSAHDSSDQGYPPHGARSEAGKRSTQEDRFSACPNLCQVWLPGPDDAPGDSLPERLRFQARLLESGADGPQRPAAGLTEVDGALVQSLHMFGVFDGHAGDEVSRYCSKRLHHNLRSALVDELCPTCPQLPRGDDNDDIRSTISTSSLYSHMSHQQSPPRSPLTRSPAGSELMLPSDDSNWMSRSGPAALSSLDLAASGTSLHSLIDTALLRAFLMTDHELSMSSTNVALVGSTAVVALVGNSHIWLANCGEWQLCLRTRTRAGHC